MSDVVLLFSGQGAQKVGMGKDFHEASETARALFRKADAALTSGLSEGEAKELRRLLRKIHR